MQEKEQEMLSLKQEFKKLEDSHEEKMNKAKSFYEHELFAARSQIATTDEEAVKRFFSHLFAF